MSNLVLRIVSPVSGVKNMPLGRMMSIRAEDGAQYMVLDRNTMQAVDGVVLKQHGGALRVEVNNKAVAYINQYFKVQASFLTEGSVGSIASAPVQQVVTPQPAPEYREPTPESAPSRARAKVTQHAEEPVAPPSRSQSSANDVDIVFEDEGSGGWFDWGSGGGFSFGENMGSIMLAGAGLLGLAALGGGSKDDNNTPLAGSGGTAAAVPSILGSVKAGPLLAGHGLRVQLFKANGTELIQEVDVDDNGRFVLYPNYNIGPMILKVLTDSNAAGDYLDEATGQQLDLTTNLYAVLDVNANANQAANINPLTTIAYQILQSSLTGNDAATAVRMVNNAIAKMFKIDDLHTTAVTTVNGSTSFSSNGGYDASENYGAALAALSGVDAMYRQESNSNPMVATIQYFAQHLGIDVNSGVAVLDQQAQAVLLQGQKTYNDATSTPSAAKISEADIFAPAFSSSATATIAESSVTGRTVYTAAASDISAVTYSLLPADDGAKFSMGANGVVSLIGAADFETKPKYHFTIQATDASQNRSSLSVTLDVSNVDEVAPTITSGDTASTIAENSGANQVVYTVTSTDSADVVSGAAATTYSLKTGAGDSDLFTIDAASGQVRLVANPNYEAKPSYSFTVVAKDAANNSREKVVTLAVSDVAESGPDTTKPVFTSSGFAEVSEGVASNSVVYTANASDANSVYYSLDTTSGDHSLFDIDSNSGTVTYQGTTPIDYEQRTQYSFTVIAKDEAGNSASRSVVLTVNNVDEVAPVITSGATATTLAENSGANQVVYTVTSSDSDVIGTSGTKYSLKTTAGDSSLFSIDATSGEVRLVGNPDFETKASYSFTVIAKDSANNSSAEKVVTLAITDVVEPTTDTTPPVFTSATTAAINEGAGKPIVYTAVATDVSSVSYRLVAIDDHALFSIDSAGQVRYQGTTPLDYEQKAQYKFTVEAKDQANNTATQTVVLTINNVDEVAPVITSGATATTLAENSGANQVVYTVTSTDSEVVGTSATSYSLKAGAGDSDLFSIDATSGAVRLVANPDFETKASYSFTVVAKDAANNSSAEKVVTLAITDVAESGTDTSKPVFTSATTASINEGGTHPVVYTAVATDNSSVSYSLDAKDDYSYFTIDTAGQVHYQGSKPLDYEQKAEYRFTVIATDQANNSQSQAVVLKINNIDEAKPVITSSDNVTAINENSGGNQLVYTVTSSDVADIAVGNTVYSLKSVGDYASFSINSSSGEVKLIPNPDFETKSSYSFTVVATDQAGNSSEKALSLPINNIAEAGEDSIKPVMTSGSTAAALPENSGANKTVYQAEASDNSGVVIYSLDTASQTEFTINSSTGEVKLKADPDYETKANYSFVVRASDHAQNYVEKTVSLAIANVDEKAPVFTSAATANVNENVAGQTTVYTAATTDSDVVSGSTVYTFKAVTGDDADAFTIDNNTGVVKIKNTPDQEQKASYTFTVQARDGGNNTADKTVTLTINDLDESAPTITSAATAAAVNENSAAETVVYTITATDTGDVSSGSLIFGLEASGDHDAFTVNGSTGEVKIKNSPDYETKSSYTFTVIASDQAGNSSKKTVTLPITDLTETGTDTTPPAFTSAETATVNSSTFNYQNDWAYKATATDANTVGYSLKVADDAASFAMSGSTGEMYFLAAPTKSQYVFTVIAQDVAGNKSERKVTLTVSALGSNNPPVAVNDSTSTIKNTAVTISSDLLFGSDGVGSNNDYDSDSTSFANIKIINVGSNGKLQLNSVDVTANQVITVADVAAGKLRFVPSSNYTGSTASFQYQVSDGNNYSGTATVNVTVNEPANVVATLTPRYTSVELETTNVANSQDIYPVMAAVGSSGQYVLAWQGRDQEGDDSVYVQLFNADGSKSGAAIKLENGTETGADDHLPQIVVRDNGRFSVVWHVADKLLSQNFTAAGAKDGAVVQIATSSGIHDSSDSSVSHAVVKQVSAAGDYVVAMLGESQRSGDPGAIVLQKFKADGTAFSTTIGVQWLDGTASASNSYEQSPQVAAIGSSGEYVVVWSGIDAGTDGDTSIFVQKFASDGSKHSSGIKTLEATGVTNNQDFAPKVIGLGSSGSYLVAWTGVDSDGNYGAYLRKFATTGEPVGTAAITLNSTTGTVKANDTSPAIAALGDEGAFAVAWVGQDTDGDNSIFVQQVSKDLVQSTTVSLEVGQYGIDTAPTVAAVGSSGEFVVVWQGHDSRYDYSIMVQKFNANGTKSGDIMVLEAPAMVSGQDYAPVVTALGTGGAFTVSWYGQDSGGDLTVFNQKFGTNGLPDYTATLSANVAMDHDETVQVSSNVAGTIYLVNSGVAVSLISSITAAADNQWNQATAASANTAVSMSLAGLAAGTYRAYATDGAGSLSSASSATITIAADSVAPVASLFGLASAAYYPSANSFNGSSAYIGSAGHFVTAYKAANTANTTYQVSVVASNASATTILESTGIAASKADTVADAPKVIAVGSAGDYVVAWHGADAGGDNTGFVQKFSYNGTKVGSILSLEPAGVTGADDTQVDILALGSAGEYVAAWAGMGASNGDYNIYLQRFDSSGAKTGSEIKLDAVSGKHDLLPHLMTVGSAGDFVVRWFGNDGTDLMMQRYTSSGTAVGSSVKLDTSGTTLINGNWLAQSAALHNGTYVIAWTEEDVSGRDQLFFQRYTSAGVKSGTFTSIETRGIVPDDKGAVALSALGSDGSFVLAWVSQMNAIGEQRLFTQKVKADGTLDGQAVMMPAQNPSDIQLKADGSSGAYQVSWSGNDAYGQSGLFVQKVATNGSPDYSGEVFANRESVLTWGSELGKAYLVSSSETVTSESAIQALADSKWNSANIEIADSSTGLALSGLAAGKYKLYTADNAGNLSAAAPGEISISQVVVFDLVEGVSSSHSNRTFQSGVDYTIYIRVDSASKNLSVDGSTVATWGKWSGANNLGADDEIILVGSGSDVLIESNLKITKITEKAAAVTWKNGTKTGAALDADGKFYRGFGGANNVVVTDLWNGTVANFTPLDVNVAQKYLTAMPANVLATQGLV